MNSITFTSFSLILLSFFILLNSQTQPNREKTENVLESLGRSFVRSPVDGNSEQAKGVGLVETELDKFTLRFKQTKQLAELTLIQKNDSYEIEIPHNKVFSRNDVQLKAEVLETLRELAAGLKGLGLQADVRVELLSSEFSDLILAGSQASSLYRAFLDLGADAEQISTFGLIKAPDEGMESRVSVTIVEVSGG